MACIAAGAMAAVIAPAASAHIGTVTMGCSGATYTYDNISFSWSGDLNVQTVQETVYLDGSSTPTAQTTVQVNPSAAGDTTSTLAFSVPADGKPHTVTADALNLTTGEEIADEYPAANQTTVNGAFPVSQTVTCTPVTASGALTPGYWKNHQKATTALLPQYLGGYEVSQFSQATSVFAAMNCGNAGPIGCLAGHLLAAELSAANGAKTPSCAASAIDQANGLLSTIGYNGPGTYTLTSDQASSALALKNTLDSYTNNNLTC